MLRKLLLTMLFVGCTPHNASYMSVTKDFIDGVQQDKQNEYRLLCSENCRNFINNDLYDLTALKHSGTILRDSLSANGLCAWVWMENNTRINLIKLDSKWLVEAIE